MPRLSDTNKRKNSNRFVRFSEHFRQNCPLGTLKMALRASRFQNFLGGKNPKTPQAVHPIDTGVIRR